MDSTLVEEIVSTRHNRAVKALYDLCKESGIYKEVNADHVATDSPYTSLVVLSHHTRGQPELLTYNPDVWGKLRKTNKIDVYEVWDSQSDEASISDVLLSALTLNIGTLSIVCFDGETKTFAHKLVKIILNSVRNSNGEPLLDPSEALPYIVELTAAEPVSDAAMKEALAESLNLSPENGIKAPYEKGRTCGKGNHQWVRRGNYEVCTRCHSSKTVRR